MSVDWAAIRADYEQGLSLRQLAAKYSVSKSVIGDRKFKEKWTERTDNRTDGNTQGVINRDVNAAVRVVQAIPLRQAGWTYDRIAHECGYASPGAARNAIQNELDRVIVQSIDAWRNDHTSRLEKQHETIWPLAVPDPKIGGVDGSLARARFLPNFARGVQLPRLGKKTEDDNGPQIFSEQMPTSHFVGAHE